MPVALDPAGISRSFDALMCDLDGVIYRGDRLIEGAPAAIRRLRERGVRVIFCTNNSRSTVDEYVGKLNRFGIDALDDDVLTSGVVTSEVLAAQGYAGKTAIVIGDRGVRESLTSIGVVLNDDPGSITAEAVVVGWDVNFDYSTMRRVSSAVRNGAKLFATNRDSTFPAPEGLWPGAGAILASIEVASGRAAEIVGKPYPPMMEAVARRMAGARRIAAVGDRADSDLAGAVSMGWVTILVLSGVTTRSEANALEPPPDLVVASLADLG
ncbi:MAG: HAD-IIA family hydrolase [Actinomycetota bacterium]|nr:HAD-IIA family hydrolase [Actinomycetota bacterium]